MVQRSGHVITVEPSGRQGHTGLEDRLWSQWPLWEPQLSHLEAVDTQACHLPPSASISFCAIWDSLQSPTPRVDLVRVQGVAMCKPLGRGGFGGELATPTPVPTQSHPLLLSASPICLNFTHLGTPQTGGTPKGVGGSCWPGSGKKDYREFKNKKKTNKSHPASYFHHAPTKLKQCEIKYSSLPGQVTPPPHAPRTPLPRPSAVPSRSQWCWQQDSQGTQPPLCAFPAPPCSGGHLDLPPVPQGPRQLFQSVFPLFHTLCTAGTLCPSSLSRLNHKLGA